MNKSNMEINREKLLEMDKQRKALEDEIMKLTEFLTGEGMPGINGSLIDNEGFPIPNVDHSAIKIARNSLACKQNDLKDLMLLIEKGVFDYFNQSKNNKTEEIHKEKQEQSEPIAISVPSEDPNKSTNGNDSSSITQQSTTKQPFAIVNLIMANSPAEECGLREGDGIILFDNILSKGVSNNPLQTLSQIATTKVNQEIPIDIVRKNDVNLLEIKHLKLIPHQWSGNGILGCKLNLIN